jgi:hypothetical protein
MPMRTRTFTFGERACAAHGGTAPGISPASSFRRMPSAQSSSHRVRFHASSVRI